MRLLSTDDLVETFCKIRQRGLSFVLSKFHLNPLQRTLSTFNETDVETSNWWIVPEVRTRWNRRISGDPGSAYEDHVLQKHFAGRSGLKMLSLGSGPCVHERRFAESGVFAEVRCIDAAEKPIDAARRECAAHGLACMRFEVADINRMTLPIETYDLILFDSSLHHFRRVREMLGDKVRGALKKEGLLVINEFVGPNRIQLPRPQLRAINAALRTVPPTFRARHKCGILKRSVSGPGLLRMLLADPSECVESASIVPALREFYDVVEEAPLGGNLLFLLLKDISHHFVTPDAETRRILESLFRQEDAWLLDSPSDFLFGVYRKK
ncbi:MAG: class I SAM-dependent methyltransferase [Fibrobacterota bacterium]